MDYKKLIQTLGFTPKENTIGIFHKKYSSCDNYCLEVDFEKELFIFGDKIIAESKTTQNFSQSENWVVLECVDRLLNQGYKPENIVLEKTYPSGHGTSGRLDILVIKEDGSAFLMIECKTWGPEFEKELKNLEKNGGQLFTYFQQDKNADILMLYTSKVDKGEVSYRNIIIKIEEDYRQTGNVKDLYERWNKLPKTNGIFDNWVSPYDFQSKALTKKDLQVLKQEDSSFIFNRFLEILRHNVVSDKPNAFNKIFTLFLCKIVDEYSKNEDDQLDFQWIEGEDNHIKFQKRLTDLYRKGMRELLEKKVTDVSDDEFDVRFQQVDEKYRDEIKDILTTIRLKKNNEFAIKEVYDDTSFEENAKVVKEVVELLQVYQIRYNYRQQFLSDFFELLLTTGLKQESGQFFTPVPIARFIIKSLPLPEITAKKIAAGNKNDLLPTIIDYAAGSGHFLTESMEEVQKYIDNVDEKGLNPTTKRAVKKWKEDQFDWAEQYVYGIEKDYRLVKTAKVSCYLHGDGLAKVIHGDGLGDFATYTEYKDLLKETDKTYPQDNKQFDIIISNPPYSVSAFKGLMDEEKSKKGFELFNKLTDQSSEIECLFIERTKQLLKDGGVAGIILPSSILSNAGIYTQSREIILKYFDILAIAELGSNTFMATNTSTVTFFLRRRNNADATNIAEAVKKIFATQLDVTVNGIENPLTKYIAHTWEGISLDDYKTLITKTPNKKVSDHELYQEYKKKIKGKDEAAQWEAILTLEQEKLTYFIIAYPQKLVLVNSGGKIEEKRFLGYEFSNRRGNEGIHPIQRKKSIDECTHLYDADSFDHPDKASTYIYKAFNGKFDLPIPKELSVNLSYGNLVDMLTFDRVDFEKNLSLSAKKKIKFESKWDLVLLKNIAIFNPSKSEVAKLDDNSEVSFIEMASVSNAGEILDKIDRPFSDVKGGSYRYFLNRDIIIAKITPCMENGKCAIVGGLTNGVGFGSSEFHVIRTSPKLNNKYLFSLLNRDIIREYAESNMTGASGHRRVPESFYSELSIPLPPINIQKKIVDEIDLIGTKETILLGEIEELQNSIFLKFESFPKQSVSSICKISTRKENPSSYPEKEYVYLGLEHIESNTGKLTMNMEFGENILSSKNKFKSGDILYGKLRPYLNKVLLVDFEGICSTDIIVLETRIPSILKYALRAPEFVKQTTDLMSGTSLPRIKPKDFLALPISIPTSKEEPSVVSEIEKIETKIKSLEKQIEEIPKQKEAVLKKYL